MAAPPGVPSIEGLTRLLDDPSAAAAWGTAAGISDPDLASRSLRTLAEAGLTFDLLGSLAAALGRLLPEVSDPDRVLVALERFLGRVRSPLSTAALFDRDPRSLETLLRIFSASPHLAELVIADPESWEEIRVGQGRPEKKESLAAALRSELAVAGDAAAVMRTLRRFKRRELLRIAYGDIVVGQRLELVVAQISHLADVIVAEAIRIAIGRLEKQRGIPRDEHGQQATLAAIALGKLGGAELNYSSDIDLVFVSSAEGRVTGPKPCTNQEFFERAVQEVVRLIGEPTELGIAYRVDLRLRPHGGTGPAAMTIDGLLQFYDREGRTWERQAWVKARCVGGDETLGGRVLAGMEPWVYQRWLTRAEIGGITSLKRQIEQRAIRAGTDASDVKHGLGGIRDIEFTIQFLQLLGGGDTPAVRTPTTLDAIRRLAEAGALTDKEREILERNYTLLRTVEHRLQILYDRQTHLLPEAEEAFSGLAVRMGYGRGQAAAARLRTELTEATTLNRRILDHLLHDAFPDDVAPEPEMDLVLDPEPAEAFVSGIFSTHHFRDPDRAYQTFTSLAEERVRFLSTRRCRHFLAAIAPRLLAAIGRTPDPDATLSSLAAVSDSLGGKGVLWELLSDSPAALDLTVRMCASSPFLASLLVANPGMIDELLDSLVVQRLPGFEALEATLEEVCRNAADISAMLHAFKASQRLRVGIRDMLGLLDVDTTTAALTTIAEVILRRVLAAEEAILVERYGEPMAAGERAGAMVLAMGKFGGREMNYASDLDVVFLYDHEGTTRPSRRRRRSAETTTNGHFFGDLARRVMKAFNASSSQGRLYEIDSRLRPSGSSGPAAIPLAELERYFAADGPAAVWERQALVKVRPVAGPPAASAAAIEIVHRAAYGRPWTADEVESIRGMRLRMEEGAKPANLKRGPGGIVDIEFIAQMLQVVHGGGDASLRTPETRGALAALQRAGRLDREEFLFLDSAYRTLRRIECRLRLVDAAARHDFPAGVEERRRLAHLMVHDDPDGLAAEVAAVTARTRLTFEAIFDRTVAAMSGS